MDKFLRLIKKYNIIILVLLLSIIVYQRFMLIKYENEVNSFNIIQYRQTQGIISNLEQNLANTEESNESIYISEAEKDIAYILSTISPINQQTKNIYEVINHIYVYIFDLKQDIGEKTNNEDLETVITKLQQLKEEMEPAYYRIGTKSSIVLTDEQRNNVFNILKQENQ
ncbi:MAG: hypothetical protein AB1420_10780 [Bacillota bacterium]